MRKAQESGNWDAFEEWKKKNPKPESAAKRQAT